MHVKYEMCYFVKEDNKILKLVFKKNKNAFK